MNALLRQAPNILSALRLVAAPIAAFLILHGIAVAALCVFVFAGLSDALDGFLAKRFALTSRFGAWLDPAADKLLMLASFVTLTMVGAVPLWLTVLVIGRDAAIVVGVGLARLLEAPLQITPLTIGKASTVVQVVYVALVLLQLAADLSLPRLVFAGTVMVAIFALLSFFAYTYVWLQAVAAGRRAA
ncbi:MAG: CDP-alcohol phosphatidyltransferase family protein [Rhizomicrobium sp.]